MRLGSVGLFWSAVAVDCQEHHSMNTNQKALIAMQNNLQLSASVLIPWHHQDVANNFCPKQLRFHFDGCVFHFEVTNWNIPTNSNMDGLLAALQSSLDYRFALNFFAERYSSKSKSGKWNISHLSQKWLNLLHTLANLISNRSKSSISGVAFVTFAPNKFAESTIKL